MNHRILLNPGNEPFPELRVANNTASLLSTETGRSYIAVPYGDGFAIQCSEAQQADKQSSASFGEIYLRPAWRSLMPELFVSVVLLLAIVNMEALLSLIRIDVLQAALYQIFQRTFSWDMAVLAFQGLFVVIFVVYVMRMLFFRYSHWYFIGPKGVESNVGIISKDQTRIEFKHIRGANMRQTFLGRFIGYGTIVIPTSGQEVVVFRDISNPGKVLSELRYRLRELA